MLRMKTLGIVCAALLVVGTLSCLPAFGQETLKPEERAAVILNSARKAFNDQQYVLATERFQEYLKDFGGMPDAVSARFGAALCLLEGQPKSFQAAIDQLNPVVGTVNFVDRPLALYYLGLAYRGLGREALRQGQAQPAQMAQFEATAKQRFNEALPRFVEALAAQTARVTALPATAPQRAIEIEWTARVRCDLAEMLLRLDRFKEALDAVAPFATEPTLAKSRYRSLGLYQHGYAATELKDFLTAGRSLSQLAPFNDPVTGTHARYLLARTHHLADESEEAAAHYEAVVAGYEQQKLAATQQLQKPDTFKNDPDEKLRLETLVKAAPEYVSRAGFHWGVLLFEQRKFAESAAKFTAFATLNPLSPLLAQAQLRLGMCQVELKQPAEAIKTLPPLTGHAELGDRASLWLARATLLTADRTQPAPFAQVVGTTIGHLKQAVEKSQQMIAKDPEAKLRKVEAQLELGDASQLVKQYAEAAATYQLAVNENNDPARSEDALQRLATALHLAGQFDPADQKCQQFATTYPRSPLLPAVMFRFAENAYFRAAASDPGKPLSQSPERQKWLNEAVKRYQPVLDKTPEFAHSSLALYRLGVAFSQLGQLESAVTTLGHIPQADRTGELTAVSYHQADVLIRTLPDAATDDALAAARLLKSVDAAAKLLEGYVANASAAPAPGVAIVLPAELPDAMLKLGYCYQRLAAQVADAKERGELLNKARQSYEKMIAQFATSPLMPTAVFERAKCMLQAGDVGGASNELTRFRTDPLKQSAVAPIALLRLSAILRTQNKSADAVTLLAECRAAHEGALKADPARAAWAPLLVYHHALALKESGKLAEARPLFETVPAQYAASPQAPDAAWRAGQCRKDEALLRLDAARKLLAKPGAKPEELVAPNKELQDSLIQLRVAGKYFQDQVPLALKVPGSGTQLNMLYDAAWAYRIVGDEEIAAVRRQMAEDSVKKRREELAKLAATPGATPGSPPLAVPDIRLPEIAIKAVPLQPTEVLARQQYDALLKTGSTAAVAQQSRLELAEMHATRDEFDAAATLLLDAIDQEPPVELEHRLRLRLGDCLLAKGDPKSAQEQFAAVAADPKSPQAPEARYRTGECYLRQENWAKAIEQLLPFRDQGPLQNIAGLSDRAVVRLGHAYALAGQWDASRQSFEVALQRFAQSPSRFEARYGIGWAWQNQKQFDNAVAAYQQVARETASEIAAKAQLQVGLCRFEQKKLPEAAAALLVVPYSYDYPEWNAAALYQASRVFVELKQPEQAKRLLQRLLKDYPESPFAKTAREQVTAATEKS